MLIQRIASLIVEGYAGYPDWYLAVMGWGTVAFFVVAALVLTGIRWRRSPDAFRPWPPLPDRMLQADATAPKEGGRS